MGPTQGMIYYLQSLGLPVQVEQCRFAAFAAGPPHYDTVSALAGGPGVADPSSPSF